MTPIVLLAPRQSLLTALARQRGPLLAILGWILFPIAFYLVLLGLLAVRFGHLPNYVVAFDWPNNVMHIVASTGSISRHGSRSSMNEWLLEIGYMNYDYGRGVSEWSLADHSAQGRDRALIGALIGFNFILLIATQAPARHYDAAVAAVHPLTGLMTALGALCASLTCITLYWVMCHSGPTWVVSLAILGIDVSTAYALEPIGPTVSLAGVALLGASILLIVRDGKIAGSSAKAEAAPC